MARNFIAVPGSARRKSFISCVREVLMTHRISRNPLHPAGDGSLGDIKAQHEQFAMNARRTPGWVLCHHPEDQLSNFARQFFPTDLFPRLRDQTPVQSKTSAIAARLQNPSWGERGWEE